MNSTFSNLRRLLRHPRFRTLLGVRILTQSADGALQVGMASHILFNPADQPDAWSVAAMLAITLLPFSVVGPFVSGLLDHWQRRQVAVVVDAVRCALAVVVAVLVGSDANGSSSQAALFAALMVALALNRFLLAGLAAALQHTIGEDEFLTASALMPMVGPLGLLASGAVAATIRVVGAQFTSTDRADAGIFLFAALLWAGSVALASRVPRHAFGPLTISRVTRASETWHALAGGLRHLRERQPAALGVATITLVRAGYGATLTTVILLFRNHFHDATQLGGAMAGVGGWMALSAAGFALSVAVVPPVAHRIGMRATVVVTLLASAAVQLGPGSVLHPTVLLLASPLIGLLAQSLKVCIDTIVQAHTDDEFKGRVFVVYDALFNAGVVVGAVTAAALLPADGASRALLAGIGLFYLAIGVGFWAASARIGRETFDAGTELALRAPA